MNQYRLGLTSVSFRSLSPKEILEAVSAAGLSCVEWGSDVHAPVADSERLAQIAALSREFGIECCSYGTYFKIGKHSIGELEPYIHAAKALGTDVLRIWCGRKSGAEMTEEEREALLLDCRRAASIAKEHGVTLCLECHQKSFTERCEDALWLMRSVASPHFRMYWQPFCERTADENAAYAKAIAPYSEHLHVFNWRGEKKLPLGEAIEDWTTYLRCFEAPRTLLLEFMPNDVPDELSAEAAALKTIVGGIV